MKKHSRKLIQLSNYSHLLSVRIVVLASLIFLYAPLIVLVIFSFNASKRNIVWQGFTTKYYVKALHNEALIEALLNSVTIALLSTIVSLMLAFCAAYSLWRFRFPLKSLVNSAIGVPIVIPEICMGVAMLTFFNSVGWPQAPFWPLNMLPVILAHITFSFPFMTMVIRSRLENFNPELEEVSTDLGANRWQTLWGVVIPYLLPSFLAASILGITLSLDDFVITFFTSTPATITFPVKIYSMVRFSVTPEVNAASTVLIATTLLLVLLALWMQRVLDSTKTN